MWSSLQSGRYTTVFSNDKHLVVAPRTWQRGATNFKYILCGHGHGGDCTGHLPGGFFGSKIASLVNSGYVVVAIDHGGGTGWNAPDTNQALTDAYNYFITNGAKVGLMGYSFSGPLIFTWIKNNPNKVACAWLWEPLTDMRWAANEAGYTTPYTSWAVDSTWKAEIDAHFSGNFAANGAGYKVVDQTASWKGQVPINIVMASDDNVIPPASASWFVGQVNDPHVTLRSPAPTGGHTGVFPNIPDQEVVSFYDRYL